MRQKNDIHISFSLRLPVRVALAAGNLRWTLNGGWACVLGALKRLFKLGYFLHRAGVFPKGCVCAIIEAAAHCARSTSGRSLKRKKELFMYLL